ncbi:methyltransferase [Nocardioides flavescens]|uniref:Methyltransferase domain-containing protein n=1 Tax=Nocardioides flavescens TaxID=2691959 RepID=A0A6L7EVR0_9ACTN|nr:methyltransferase domain-containing protein [Nocardioides flavescens]
MSDAGEHDEVVLRLVLDGLPTGRAMPDVLEVGCGDGAFAERFTTAHPHVAYLATDASPAAVELTRARGVPAQLMDVGTLLAGEASYDVAVAVRVLDHLADLDRGLGELRRVLRPGGRLVAVVEGPDDDRTEDRLESALRRHFAAVTRTGDLRVLTAS